MRKKSTKGAETRLATVGEFVPIDRLWDSGEGKALFPSEVSARWYWRSNKKALLQAQAVMLHAGRLMIHPVRFASAAEEIGLAAARARCGAA